MGVRGAGLLSATVSALLCWVPDVAAQDTGHDGSS